VCAADDAQRVKSEAPHTLHVAKESFEAPAGLDIPDLESVVQRPRDQLAALDLEALHLRGVASKLANNLALAEIPHDHAHIVRSREHAIAVEFDAIDAVEMSSKPPVKNRAKKKKKEKEKENNTQESSGWW